MNTTSDVGKLNAFGIKVGKCDVHMRAHRKKMLYYLCTWSIRNFFSIQSARSWGTLNRLGFNCDVRLLVKQEEIEISVTHPYKDCVFYKRGVTILTHGGIVLFHETKKCEVLNSWSLDVVLVKGEDFQKLKQFPNDTFILCYRIKRNVDEGILKHICNNTSVNNAVYLKSLEADLKNSSNSFLKQKVSLCVGQETEIVNKAVLCAQSPVFAKMFDSDMKENIGNTVTITDIKMRVLRALVSFLSSGLLPDCDFDFLCDLYYAANKYDIWELRQACIRLLLGKVTCGNVLRLFKLSILHNDELLKSAAMTLISANIKTVALSRDWKDLMCDDPVLALKASTFFDF